MALAATMLHKKGMRKQELCNKNSFKPFILSSIYTDGLLNTRSLTISLTVSLLFWS